MTGISAAYRPSCLNDAPLQLSQRRVSSLPLQRDRLIHTHYTMSLPWYVFLRISTLSGTKVWFSNRGLNPPFPAPVMFRHPGNGNGKDADKLPTSTEAANNGTNPCPVPSTGRANIGLGLATWNHVSATSPLANPYTLNTGKMSTTSVADPGLSPFGIHVICPTVPVYYSAMNMAMILRLDWSP
jgi:hypothetical protein